MKPPMQRTWKRLVPTPQTYDAFAIAPPGLEPLVRYEIRELGAIRAREVEGGVEFRASRELLYAANLHARVASRVVVRVAEFEATSFAELERRARSVNWERWITKGSAIRLRVTCRKSRLYHSSAVEQRVFDAINRAIGATRASETAEDDATPDPSASLSQLLTVRLFRDRCTVSLDSSGALLHQRGYRLASGKAPMRESLAAAVLMASRWSRTEPLLDPFCGSGTIAIEAALVSRRIPPGLNRDFAFMRWPAFDAAIWDAATSAAREHILPTAGAAIRGSDRDAGAVKAATANAERAGVSSDIEITRSSASAIEARSSSGWLVTNPPYGVRVGESSELRDLYARFGTVLRDRFGGWHVAILSGDRRLEAQLRIPLEERLATLNGGLHVRLVTGRLPDRST